MIKTKIDKTLEEEYPGILQKVKEWDCGFSEAVARIEKEERDKSLDRWIKNE